MQKGNQKVIDKTSPVMKRYAQAKELVPAHLRAAVQPGFPHDWEEIDSRSVDTVRILAADAVQKAKSGHPGTAMSLAPLAYTLFQRIMRHDPAHPDWVGRDRFVQSCGHSSMTIYAQLFLGGFGLEREDIQQLRTWGSLTPGHPEYGHTKGVEITTGPLGQGLASAVGMAMAARRERGLFDPEAPAGDSPFDHYVYVIASDGDLEEGVTAEACSLAGTQKLGNMIALWDDNRISIENDTAIAFDEDVCARFESYGWQVLCVESGEDVQALEAAITLAQRDTDRPTLIRVRTVIGYPAPTKMNSGAVHGAALGNDEVAGVKRILGFDPEQSFEVPDDVLTHTRALCDRGATAHAEWLKGFDRWADQNPERKALFDRLMARELPEGWDADLPVWDADDSGVATRKASEAVIQALGAALPELWGGSADLAGSNNTTIKDADSFGPPSISTDSWTAHPYGRVLHFGIREHAMGSILNGIALHGPTRPYGGTFLVFSDYMRPAVRLAALMKTDVYYVWTHDSIGLGEDGPTHQPVEHLASLRAIPNLAVFRPADANETAASWRAAIDSPAGPKAFALSRQNVPVLAGTKELARDGVRRGAYVLVRETVEAPKVIIMASGSEVQLAVVAAKSLDTLGIPARVVSVPCMDWFLGQDQSYQDEVLPPGVSARVSVEAGIAMPWHQLVGSRGRTISLEHFGASASAGELFDKFGFTVDAIVDAAKSVVEK